jgi:hypothetical protein
MEGLEMNFDGFLCVLGGGFLIYCIASAMVESDYNEPSYRSTRVTFVIAVVLFAVAAL